MIEAIDARKAGNLQYGFTERHGIYDPKIADHKEEKRQERINRLIRKKNKLRGKKNPKPKKPTKTEIKVSELQALRRRLSGI